MTMNHSRGQMKLTMRPSSVKQMFGLVCSGAPHPSQLFHPVMRNNAAATGNRGAVAQPVLL